MAEYNYTFHEMFKLGYISTELPDDIFSKIKKDITFFVDSDFKDLVPHDYLLAGVIEKEYQYPQGVSVLEPFLNRIAKLYYKQWDDELAKKEFVFETTHEGRHSLWLNFQKKYEYNPPHTHSGLLSFVIWLNIPYDRTEEMRLKKHEDGRGSVTDFQFLIPDPFSPGGISHRTIPVDKSYEGKLILFHSGMWHLVNPFFASEGYRISIAGNLVPKDA